MCAKLLTSAQINNFLEKNIGRFSGVGVFCYKNLSSAIEEKFKKPGDLVYWLSGKDVLGRFLLGTFLRRLFHFAAAVVVAVHVRGILLLYYLIFLILHTTYRNDIHAVRPLICILANADNDCHK